MKRIVRKNILFAAMTVAFSMAAAAAFAQEVGGGGAGQQKLELAPVVPESLDDKLKAAGLVVLGRVESIRERDKKKDDNSGGVRETRRNMVAVVRVKETFKGSVAGETIEVEFIESTVTERPPFVTLARGEECVLFLRNSEGGRFALIGPTFGKERPSASLMAQLSEKTGATPEERGKVGLQLRGAAEPGAPGAPVIVKLTISNSSRGEALSFADLAAAAEFAVAGPDGKPVEPRVARGGGKLPTVLLPPKHFFGAEIDLSKLYDFSAPGIYRVTARLPMPGTGGTNQPATLVSNTVSVSIVKK